MSFVLDFCYVEFVDIPTYSIKRPSDIHETIDLDFWNVRSLDAQTQTQMLRHSFNILFRRSMVVNPPGANILTKHQAKHIQKKQLIDN